MKIRAMPMENNKLSYLLLFLFIFIFLAITLKGLATIQPGDENVYYYMGRLVSEGKVPYRDFFYAHPPLHIYLIALIYKIFGFKIIIFKSIPLISTLITAIFTFKIAKDKFGEPEAVISSLLFLFSYSVMFNSVFSFGVEFAAMLLVIGVYFITNKNNYCLAGIFFGFASITRLLSLVPIFAIMALILFSNKKNFFKLSSIFFAVFLAANAFFSAFAGSSYLNSVYRYHLVKGIGGYENIREYTDIIELNWILFLPALSIIFAKDKKPARLFAVISISYLLFLFALKKLFGFYFIMIFPFIAILSGYSIANFYRHDIKRNFKILFFSILSLIFLWNLISDIIFLQSIGFVGFQRGNDLVEFINLNSDKKTMLFGDASVVPLLALVTDKKIALDFADTNDQVFSSGVVDINQILRNLKGKNVLFIIRDKGLSSLEEVRNFTDENCEFLSGFNDKIEGNYIIYKCK